MDYSYRFLFWGEGGSRSPPEATGDHTQLANPNVYDIPKPFTSLWSDSDGLSMVGRGEIGSMSSALPL